ncbi:MAG: C4-type zinc ribbon domain-containing protein [Nitrospirae bacterium]|nr:C4-type zinc ribbon domain-containing protein [Nitrospirota bacterium]
MADNIHQLRLLVDIQRLDSAILLLRQKIDKNPSAVSSINAALSSAQEISEKAGQIYVSLEKKKKEKESAIDDINERIKKMRQRSSELKTNKEYQTHLKEIERAESELRNVEDELLSIMVSMDEAAGSVQKAKAELETERARAEAVKREIQKEIESYEIEIHKLKQERDKLAEKIESDVYDQYIGLLQKGDGLAVVEVKDEICHGCNLHIPPQLFVQIKASDEIFHCPQCRRMLYYLKETTNSNNP